MHQCSKESRNQSNFQCNRDCLTRLTLNCCWSFKFATHTWKLIRCVQISTHFTAKILHGSQIMQPYLQPLLLLLLLAHTHTNTWDYMQNIQEFKLESFAVCAHVWVCSHIRRLVGSYAPLCFGILEMIERAMHTCHAAVSCTPITHMTDQLLQQHTVT